MIKLLHTSDWHLGRFLFGKSLLEDQSIALERYLEVIDRVGPDAILISGDVFDRALPPEGAVKLFDHFLSQVIIERGRPVFLIPGNHDSADRLGFASKLLRGQGLTIFSTPEDALRPVKIRAASGEEAMIFGIPFVEPAQVARMLGDQNVRTFDDATRALTGKMRELFEPGVQPVLLCHAFVVGGEASESERDLFVGGSSFVDVRAFEGFAYTALGHLHKPQRAGHERVRYSGSLLTYSKSEVEHTKSWSEVQLTGESCSIIEHSIEPRRRLRYVEGPLDELVRVGFEDARREDYILVGLTDPGPVVDALTRLRGVYPNLLHVSRAMSFSPSLVPAAEAVRERVEIDELDLFAQFVNDVTGAEISDEEREFLISSIRDLERREAEAGT